MDNKDVHSAASHPNSAPVAHKSSFSWGWALIVLLVFIIAGAAAYLAWDTQQRMLSFRETMVQRQGDAQSKIDATTTMMQQTKDNALQAQGRIDALSREVQALALQRQQVQDVLQAMTQTRHESVLTEVDAALRIAAQQVSLLGSIDPLVQAMRQAQDRVARLQQPKLAALELAIKADLSVIQEVSLVDVADLASTLNELSREVSQLPLLSRNPSTEPSASNSAANTAVPPTSEPAAASNASWWQNLWATTTGSLHKFWQSISGSGQPFFRVSRIENPSAMLLAPQEATFLQQNMQLRLLSARLALLSRQYGAAQQDALEVVQQLKSFYDVKSVRVTQAIERLQNVADSAKQVDWPQPEKTLQALADATENHPPVWPTLTEPAANTTVPPQTGGNTPNSAATPPAQQTPPAAAAPAEKATP